MKKLKITTAFKIRFSEKLMDLGNFVAAGLVISQFVSGQDFSLSVLTGGILLTIILYFAGYIISQ